MKKTYVLALATMIFLSSCNKAFQSSTPGTLNYSMQSSNTKVITAGSTLHFNPNFQVSAGDISKTPITISFYGLPDKVTLNNSFITLSTPYSPVFIFTANTTTVPGTYPMQMVVSADGIDPQTYKFNLVILPSYNCAADLITTSYTYHAGTCNGSSSYLITLDTVPSTPNMFNIYNFGNLGAAFKVSAIIDCNTNISGSSSSTSFFIPQQTVNGNTISGTGSYYRSSNHDQFYIYDTVINANNLKSVCSFSIN